MPSLRAMTLNLWGLHGPWAARKRMIRATLSSESPDVVALQEVVRTQGHGTSQADELAEGLGYRAAFGCASRIARPFPAELGNAVLTRHPIREHRCVPLPGPASPSENDEPKALLYVLLSARVGVWPVFTTHLSWEPQHAELRAAQVRFIAAYIADELRALPSRLPEHVRVLPPLFAGDLNAPPDSAEVQLLTGGAQAAFLDCFAAAGPADAPEGGATYSPRNPGTHKKGVPPLSAQRIDYLLIGREPAGEPAPPLTVRSARLVLTEAEAGVHASDHFGVLTELEV